jgi:hypothetical protein
MQRALQYVFSNVLHHTAVSQVARRDFLVLAGAGGAALCGCAADPVPGRSTLMQMSQSQEIGLDRGQSPHQFARDHGAAQDAALNAYLTGEARRQGPVRLPALARVGVIHAR